MEFNFNLLKYTTIRNEYIMHYNHEYPSTPSTIDTSVDVEWDIVICHKNAINFLWYYYSFNWSLLSNQKISLLASITYSIFYKQFWVILLLKIWLLLKISLSNHKMSCLFSPNLVTSLQIFYVCSLLYYYLIIFLQISI